MASGASERFPLRRREVAEALLAERGDLLVVAGLGSTSWDVSAAGDHPLNFPLWGAMGGAAMIGLGLALARPERRVLVIDNERYGETGMQATHTAQGVDLARIAAAAGFPAAGTIRAPEELEAARPIIRSETGPIFYAVKVRAEPLPFVLPPKDGAYLKDRFRLALLGASATAS
jgi:thiamine pyrophosphate-dependent acetolactate synthase large subunit-like protein